MGISPKAAPVAVQPAYSAYLRKQFDALVTQAKELSECAQKVATDTAEPIKESISTGFNKVA